MRAEANLAWGGGGHWREARGQFVLAGGATAVLAWCCTGPGVDKAGGTRARQPVVLDAGQLHR